jgi:photosystem II stability/assembly factor-like uncharacterized protein
MKPKNMDFVAAISERVVDMVKFLALFFLLGPCPAYALDQFKVLSEQAILVKNPSHVLLISVTAAGSRLVAVGEDGVIIYSDDNGKIWRQAVVPVSVTVTTVAFATSKDGWAAGDYGVILHTTDGGATWVIQITGVQVNQLVAAAATAFSSANPGSADTQRALRRASFFMQAGPDKPFLSILPLSSQRVIVFGAYRMCVKTSDGGQTWTDCSLDVADPISHNLYDAIQAGPAIYIAGEVGQVFRSDDQGDTFLPVTSPAGSTLFGVLAVSNNTLLAYGVAGGMFRSSDGGKNWVQVSVGTQSNLTAGMVLKSGLIVVASESGSIFVSSDGGGKFHAADVNAGMGIFDITQAVNGDFILVGNDGVRVVPLSSLL